MFSKREMNVHTMLQQNELLRSIKYYLQDTFTDGRNYENLDFCVSMSLTIRNTEL